MTLQGLESLPIELVVLILSCLDHEHLARSRRLCRRLRGLIDDTPLLRYIIEAGAAGYDCPQDEASVREAFDTFRRNQQIYRSPKVKAMDNLLVNLESTCPQLFRTTWFTCWKLHSTFLLGISMDSKSVGVLSLLPATPLAERFRVLGLQISVGALQVDLHQDLLLLQCNSELHVRSFETGHIHPRFKSALRYIILPSCMLVQGSDHIHVWGDWILFSGYRILAQVGSHINCLVHWPSGRTAKVWSSDRDAFQGCIVQGRVLVPLRNEHQSPCIEVYALPDCIESGEPRIVARFGLPGINLTLDGDGVYVTPLSPRCLPHTSSILRVGMSSYFMFVQARTFLISSDPSSAQPKFIPWAEWNHRARLVIGNGCGVPFLIGAAGNHIVFASRILDFNQYDVSNDVYGPAVPHGRVLRNSSNGASGAAHFESTPWPLGTGLLDSRVPATSLPYRRMDITIPRGSYIKKLLVEDVTGPMVVGFELGVSGAPKVLRYWALRRV